MFSAQLFPNLLLSAFFGVLEFPHLTLEFPLLMCHVPLFFGDRELLVDLVPS